jgi:hypothetical protein
MSINYSYKITHVNEEARCMEIVYTAQGHETQHIGARLPYIGETIEQIVRMYAPIAYWLEKQRSVVSPTVGTSGTINAADEQAALLSTIEKQQTPVTVQGAQTL